MNKLVKQHNSITEARYEMSALEKNIIYLLLGHLDETDSPGKTYKIARKDLKEEKGKEMNHVYFSNSIKDLVDRSLYTQYGNNKQLSVNILSSGRYNQGAIELEISNEMRVFLFALKNNFTLFNIQVALNLKSKYSKRLYEMLNQFKDTGKWFIPIDELKARLFLFDEKTGAEKYPGYGLFRTRILEVAQKELADNADITFTYEAKKTGRKYTDLVFNIKYDNPSQVKSTKPPRIEAPQQKQDKYPQDKLTMDQYKQYTYMKDEVRWLDKKTAYKVVQNVPTMALWEYIHKYKMMIHSGDENRPSPRVFFESIMEQKKVKELSLQKPLVQQLDNGENMWGECYRKLITEFGILIDELGAQVPNIKQQIKDTELLTFLKKLSEEMKQEAIPEIQKRIYVKRRLLEKFDLVL